MQLLCVIWPRRWLGLFFVATSDSQRFGAIHLVVQFLQKLGTLVGGQLTLQFFEREGDDVVVMSPGKLGIGSDVEPELVHEFDILGTHAGRVRTEGVFTDGAIGGAHFQSQAGTWFGQTFPSIAR